MVYAGRYPVAMDGGDACVFTTAGWMKVDAFEASGLSTDDLDTAETIRALSPQGHLAALYRGDGAVS